MSGAALGHHLTRLSHCAKAGSLNTDVDIRGQPLVWALVAKSILPTPNVCVQITATNTQVSDCIVPTASGGKKKA